ncbi:MAG: hypothetical protein CSA32_04635 [Desulfobulbus propionicus]|nr:MAG: hypothetical protein CSA32_04635 [Desulfobulbus propionicus]
MQRISIGAAVLLIAQVVLAVALNVQREEVLDFSQQKSFLDFDPEQVTSMEISDAETTLLLKKEGEKWVMPDSYAALADGRNVTAKLRELASVKHGLAVATTADGARRFHVDAENSERHIVLYQGEKVVADFYLGTSAGFRQTHAARAGEQMVVVLGVNSFDFTPEAKEWLDRTLLHVKEETVQRVERTGYSLEKIQKKDQKKWQVTVAGTTKPANADEAQKLLDKVAGVTVDDIVEPARASELLQQEPVLDFSLVVRDSEARLKYLFVVNDEETMAVKRSDMDHVYLVPKYLVEEIQAVTPEVLMEEDRENGEDAGKAQQ